MSKPCASPRPGPLYWDWRCLNCSEAIDEHKSVWVRAKDKLLRKLAKKPNHNDRKEKVDG